MGEYKITMDDGVGSGRRDFWAIWWEFVIIFQPMAPQCGGNDDDEGM